MRPIVLLAALAAGALLALRSCVRSPVADDARPELAPAGEVPAGRPQRQDVARAGRAGDRAAGLPAERPVDHPYEHPYEHPADSPPAELPIWERPPRTTAQPFPEAARLDPPLPPIKVPSWMIGGAVDAGSARD